MTELVTQELADRDYAKQVAVMYVASFANQPHEPGVMLGQVRDFLVGKSKSVVGQVCNPECEAVTKSDRPCLKSLKQWFDNWTGAKKVQRLEFRPSREDPPEVPREIRDAQIAKWNQMKAGKPIERKRSRLKWKQFHDPDALLRTLER